MIVEADRLQEGRGAPTRLLKLKPDGAFSIGLDLDKDHLTGVLVDFTGKVRQSISCELHFPLPEEAIDLMEATAKDLLEREGIDRERLWGVGMGLPGPLGSTDENHVTNVVNPTEFPGWSNVPVGEILEERLALPVYLENNATAAAVGERWYGEGRHIGTFFYIYFGAGLGGGLIINGQPFEGSTGNAGELGYFPMTSALNGTANVQQSHTGMHFNLPRLYQRLTEQGTPVDGPADLQPLFEQQNETLLAWLDEGATHLKPLLLAIEYLIDPEAIFFGGRLPDAIIRSLMDRLEAMLPALRVEGKTQHPQLHCATAGSDAAALGVATLPLYTSFAPAPRLLMKQGNSDGKTHLLPTHRNTLLS
jgi:predicted NBD/HSP70 family sugar kinase